MLVYQGVEGRYFVFVAVFPFCYFCYCLEESLEGHIGLVFVRRDENQIYFLLLVQVLLICAIYNNLSILHDFMKLLRFQVLHVESVSKRTVVVENSPHFSFDIVNGHLALTNVVLRDLLHLTFIVLLVRIRRGQEVVV